MKYNLDLLKTREVRAEITAYCNGQRSEAQISKTLDAICGIETDADTANIEVKDEVIEDGKKVEAGLPSAADVKEEMETATNGLKKDLVDFADKYGIDLSEATNNEKRIDAIHDWYNKTYFNK